MNNRRAFWFSACALFIFLVCIVALGNYARLHPPKISLPNNSVQPGYYKVIEFHDGEDRKSVV